MEVGGSEITVVYVPVRTFLASITCPLDEEAANVWAIALIVRVVPGHFLQHFPSSRSNTSSFYQRFARPQLSNQRSSAQHLALIQSPWAETHLALHILRIVFSINFTCWSLRLDGQSSISRLNWQPKLQVQETRLTDVLDLCASLTDHCRLHP